MFLISGVIKADKPKCPLCRGVIGKDKLVEPAPTETNNEMNQQTPGERTWSSSSKVITFFYYFNTLVCFHLVSDGSE